MSSDGAEIQSEVKPIDYLNDEKIRFLYQVSRGQTHFLVGVREYNEDEYASLELVKRQNGQGRLLFPEFYHHLKNNDVTRANAKDLADYLFDNLGKVNPDEDVVVLASVQTNSNVQEARTYSDKYWLPLRRPTGDSEIPFLVKAALILTIGFAMGFGLPAILIVGFLVYLRFSNFGKKRLRSPKQRTK